MKQVRFLDMTHNKEHGGIVLDNGDVICGCCGGLIPVDEQTEELGFKLLEEYEGWLDLDDAIIGE